MCGFFLRELHKSETHGTWELFRNPSWAAGRAASSDLKPEWYSRKFRSGKSFETFTTSLGLQCSSLKRPDASPLWMQMFFTFRRREYSSVGYATFSSSSHHPLLSAPSPWPV